ncbi:hypothetical protein CsSME_00050277 [Camellia sinensis var. sinensis]
MGQQKVVADDLLADIPSVSSNSKKHLRDSVPISKLGKAKKRPAEVEASDAPSRKKPRLQGAKGPSASHFHEPWPLAFMVGDQPMSAKDSAIDAALSIAILLPSDMNRMVEITEYENFALMMHHSVLGIQHAHSFTVKIEEVEKELTRKTKESAKLLSSLNQAKVHAKEAEAKEAQAEADLKEAIASKEAKIKAVDDKAYAKGAVSLACNKGHYLENAEVEAEVIAGDESPILNDQVLDLTQDEEMEVSKNASPKANPETEAKTAEKSLDETLLEIDAEIVAEKSTTLAPEVEILPTAEVDHANTTDKDFST